MKKIVFILTTLLVISANIVAEAKLSARVDNPVVRPNEPFVLYIDSDENLSAQPDLSVLQNLFNVVSTSVSNQTSIINGRVNSKITWHFSLIPLKDGQTTIPSISVGSEKTNPIQITVSDEAPQRDTQNAPHQTTAPAYTVQTEVISPSAPFFIQQQLNYEIRFIDDGSVQVENISFDDTDDFLIQNLRQPTVEKTADGKRLITFHYALFAQSSGLLTLPIAHIQGFMLGKPDTDSFFQNGFFGFKMPSFFGVQEPVSVRSEPKRIIITPAPSDYDANWWLPAQEVSLQAHFADMPQTVNVGSVLKRELVLKAVGLTDKQLPEIKPSADSSLKKYSEKPQGETSVVGSNVVGTLTTADVYIPQKAGLITFPEIKVSWYDLQTNSVQTAVVEEQTINVLPNKNLEDTQNNPLTTTQNRVSDYPQNAPSASASSDNPYLLVCAAFAFGMFFCYLILRPKKQKSAEKQTINHNEILSAVKKNNLKDIRDKLILWAQQNYPDHKIVNLQDVADIIGDETFETSIQNLIKALYADTKQTSFDVKNFQKTFKRVIKNTKKSQKQNDKPLPPLYS